MTYDEAIAFCFGRINFEVQSAEPKDLKLERMRAVLRLWGDPHDRLRIVHNSQDGLRYYESTQDLALHFFIDNLPKGRYPTGLADIQCMDAPEFNGHTENIDLEVE